MRVRQKNAAAVALAARRMVKMTPAQRSAVARIAAKAASEARSRKAAERRLAREAEATEPEAVEA